jgi:hypothetical protein
MQIPGIRLFTNRLIENTFQQFDFSDYGTAKIDLLPILLQKK